ncbi:hypothetical protein NC969_18640 [Leptolyngbya subtilissima ST-M1]
MAAQQELVSAITALVNQEVSTRNEPWVPVEDLVTALGSAFSVRKIDGDRRAGYFKYGRDYINTSQGTRPTYAFRVGAVRQVYQTPPEKRKVYQA